MDRPTQTFEYSAIKSDGSVLRGTIDAPDSREAVAELEALGLRIGHIAPCNTGVPQSKALRSEDFIAFNQQLAMLSDAGLPVERGLRLLAKDASSKRLASAMNAVAADLERGLSLADAFAHHRKGFPPLYSGLLDAGVRSGNLSGVLYGLGKHLELLQRLRASLWRAFAYPLMVFVGLTLVTLFLGRVVIPQFQAMSQSSKIGTKNLSPLVSGRFRRNQEPGANSPLAEFALQIGPVLPWIFIGVLGLLLALWIVALIARRTGRDAALADRFIIRLPLIGPVLRNNLIARWCDVARLAVMSGQPLPEAIALAGQTVGSPRLEADSRALALSLESGQNLSDAPPGRLLPATVPAAMDMARGGDGLVRSLGSLSSMFQQQAETRLWAVPIYLTPILLILVASVIGLVIIIVLLPMIQFIRVISG